MIPAELQASIIDLPLADRYSIVVITGRELRHDRFALRIQAEFPTLVVAWLQVESTASAAPDEAGQLRRVRAVMSKALADGPRQILSSKGRRAAWTRASTLSYSAGYRLLRLFSPSQRSVERRLFGEEIIQLRKSSYVAPTLVADPNAAETVAFVKSLKPYFIVTLGGAIYGKSLRECAKGLALNQHDGWCPEYRGSNTVEWALYHRDLSKIANTVHILTDGMDSGPILRRSIACLVEDDTPESCFARSVALGTELVCETVHELIEMKRARVFLQPQLAGRTFLARELTHDVKRDVRRDLRRGLIQRDIARRTAF